MYRWKFILTFSDDLYVFKIIIDFVMAKTLDKAAL